MKGSETMSTPSYAELAAQVAALQAQIEAGASTPAPRRARLSVGPSKTLVISGSGPRPLFARYAGEFFEHIVGNLKEIAQFTVDHIDEFEFKGNTSITSEARKASTLAVAKDVVKQMSE